MNQKVAVSVKLMGKQLDFACAPEEKAGMVAAADLANEYLQEVQASGFIGTEKIALATTLHLSYKLLRAERNQHLDGDLRQQIALIQQKLQSMLDEL